MVPGRVACFNRSLKGSPVLFSLLKAVHEVPRIRTAEQEEALKPQAHSRNKSLLLQLRPPLTEERAGDHHGDEAQHLDRQDQRRVGSGPQSHDRDRIYPSRSRGQVGC